MTHPLGGVDRLRRSGGRDRLRRSSTPIGPVLQRATEGGARPGDAVRGLPKGGCGEGRRPESPTPRRFDLPRSFHHIPLYSLVSLLIVEARRARTPFSLFLSPLSPASLSLSPQPQPQRHKHRAPHVTRALGVHGFGELRRLLSLHLALSGPRALEFTFSPLKRPQFHVFTFETAGCHQV